MISASQDTIKFWPLGTLRVRRSSSEIYSGFFYGQPAKAASVWSPSLPIPVKTLAAAFRISWRLLKESNQHPHNTELRLSGLEVGNAWTCVSGLSLWPWDGQSFCLPCWKETLGCYFTILKVLCMLQTVLQKCCGCGEETHYFKCYFKCSSNRFWAHWLKNTSTGAPRTCVMKTN